MIRVKIDTPEPSSPEQILSSQLEDDDIPFKYGEINSMDERKEKVILVGNKAIAFSPFTLTMQTNLLSSRFKPQLWNKDELRWGDLSLRRQLLLHK